MSLDVGVSSVGSQFLESEDNVRADVEQPVALTPLEDYVWNTGKNLCYLMYDLVKDYPCASACGEDRVFGFIVSTPDIPPVLDDFIDFGFYVGVESVLSLLQ